MNYFQYTPNTHLIVDEKDRKQIKVELIYSSGGSWFEQDGDRGKKHLLEHCIVSRTKDLDFQAFKDYQFKEGISMNAYTGKMTMGVTATGYYQDFNKIFDLAFETFTQPVFDQTDFEREREIVLREASDYLGNPNYILHYDRMKKTFTSDSYGPHDVIGDVGQIATTDFADLERLHRDNLERSHLLFAVSGGGANLDYVKAKLQGFFDSRTLEAKLVQNLDKKDVINYKAKEQFLDFSNLAFSHQYGHEHSELHIYLPCKVSFENIATRKFFKSLFLDYNGVVYDRLRDDLQMIYGMYANYDYELQMIEIEMTCEMKYINYIIREVEQVFSDYDKYFKPNKFEELKTTLKKKQEMMKDKLGSNASFAASNLMNYGEALDYDIFTEALDRVEEKDIKDIYESVKNGLSAKKVVAVSKDKAIEKVF